MDECKDWADKAEALASYARQSDDEELFKLATRIKARAIRRCGELLRQIPKEKTGPKEFNGDAPIKLSSREQMAKDAGMSKDQMVTALRVHSVPPEKFEELIESDDPPSVTKLAEMGTKKRLIDLGDRTPAEFKQATALRCGDSVQNWQSVKRKHLWSNFGGRRCFTV